jgi:site-specific recombinase XerD
MGRKTVYNYIVSDELYDKVLEDNKNLLSEFVEYLRSVDRAYRTVESYVADVKIFYVWNLQKNNNKFFVDLTKRDIMKYQNYLLNELGHSPNRIRRLKSALSSMSNFIESMMDDEYPDFKPIINKVSSPVLQPVREKTVLTEEQLEYLLSYLVENKKYQHACALALGIASGARKSELLRFKVSYFKDEHIKYGALYKTPEMIKTKGRSNKGKMLYKYVLVSKFKKYFELWMQEREKLGILGEELFWTKYGNDGEWKPANITTLDSYAQTFSEILNISWYWHSLRHFFTTDLCKENIPESVVKDIVGWSNLEMVNLYNDQEIDDELGKYFNEDGIKGVEKKSLSDLK